jgi:hypothetical protein
VAKQTFYRIIKQRQLRLDDFKSYEALGIPLLHDTPAARRLAAGLSVYATEQAARARARLPSRFPLGDYIARIEIDDQVIECEQTGRDPSHYTIWAPPQELLTSVVEVVPV